jgi:hypothetical protein
MVGCKMLAAIEKRFRKIKLKTNQDLIFGACLSSSSVIVFSYLPYSPARSSLFLDLEVRLMSYLYGLCRWSSEMPWFSAYDDENLGKIQI